MNVFWRVVAGLVLCAGFAPAASAAFPVCSFELEGRDYELLQEDGVTFLDMNDSGMAVGFAGDSSRSTAIVWSPGGGASRLFSHPSGVSSTATSINNDGVVVGAVTDVRGVVGDPDRSGVVWPFRWTAEDGVIELADEIAGLPRSTDTDGSSATPVQILDDSAVALRADGLESETFLTRGVGRTVYRDFCGDGAVGLRLNSTGAGVGSAGIGRGGDCALVSGRDDLRPARWGAGGGTPQQLFDELGYGFDINETGDVVGYLGDDVDVFGSVRTQQARAFRNGAFLPQLQSEGSIAKSISNDGYVGGRLSDFVGSDGRVEADSDGIVLWSPDDRVIELQKILEAAACSESFGTPIAIGDDLRMIDSLGSYIRPLEGTIDVFAFISVREADSLDIVRGQTLERGQRIFIDARARNIGFADLTNVTMQVVGVNDSVTAVTGPEPPQPTELAAQAEAETSQYFLRVADAGSFQLRLIVEGTDPDGRRVSAEQLFPRYQVASSDALLLDYEGLPAGRLAIGEGFNAELRVISNSDETLSVSRPGDLVVSSEPDRLSLNLPQDSPANFELPAGETRVLPFSGRGEAIGFSTLTSVVNYSAAGGVVEQAQRTAEVQVGNPLSVAMETSAQRETVAGRTRYVITFTATVTNVSTRAVESVTIPGGPTGLAVRNLTSLEPDLALLSYQPNDPDPVTLQPNQTAVHVWRFESFGVYQELEAETLATGVQDGTVQAIGAADFVSSPLEVVLTVRNAPGGIVDLPPDKQFFVELELTNSGEEPIEELELAGSVGLQSEQGAFEQEDGGLGFVIGPSPSLPLSLEPGQVSVHRFLLEPSARGPVRLVATATGRYDGANVRGQSLAEVVVGFEGLTDEEIEANLAGLMDFAIATYAEQFDEFQRDIAAMQSGVAAGSGSGGRCGADNGAPDPRTLTVEERALATLSGQAPGAANGVPRAQAASLPGVLRDYWVGSSRGRVAGENKAWRAAGTRYAGMAQAARTLARNPEARAAVSRVVREDILAAPGALLHNTFRVAFEPDQSAAFRTELARAKQQLPGEISAAFDSACTQAKEKIDARAQLYQDGKYEQFYFENAQDVAEAQTRTGIFVLESLFGASAEKFVRGSKAWRTITQGVGPKLPVARPAGSARPTRELPASRPVAELDDGLIRHLALNPEDLITPQGLANGIRFQDVAKIQRVQDQISDQFGVNVELGARSVNPFSMRVLFDQAGNATGSVKEEILKAKSLSMLDHVVFGAPKEHLGKVAVFNPDLRVYNSLPPELQAKVRPRLNTLQKLYRDANDPSTPFGGDLALGTKPDGHTFLRDRGNGVQDEIFQSYKIEALGDATDTRLILDAANGNRPFGGDIDIRYLIDADTGRPVSSKVYNAAMRRLRAEGLPLAKHGASFNAEDFGERLYGAIKVKYTVEGMDAATGEAYARAWVRQWNAEKRILNDNLGPNDRPWPIYDENDFINGLEFGDFGLQVTRNGVRVGDGSEVPEIVDSLLVDIPVVGGAR